MEDPTTVPASPAKDAAIPPKTLLRSLEIRAERPESLKELNVAAFPVITTLSTTYTNYFVGEIVAAYPAAAVLSRAALFGARESFPRPSRRPDLRG